MHPKDRSLPSAPPRPRQAAGNHPFRPSDGAVEMTKAQRKAIAELPGTANYFVESTNIRGAIAAVSTPGSRNTVYVIAANGTTTEF